MDLLAKFRSVNKAQFSQKDAIVERLLSSGAINTGEATILLKTVDIQIKSDSLEMSSGAKIVGGSDFETTSM